MQTIIYQSSLFAHCALMMVFAQVYHGCFVSLCRFHVFGHAGSIFVPNFVLDLQKIVTSPVPLSLGCTFKLY